MKQLILVIFLLAPSIGSGFWVEYADAGTGKLYIDKSKIKASGGFAYIWLLANLYEPFEGKYISLILYQKIDCHNDKTMTLQSTWYELHFAQKYGETYTYDNPEWEYSVPETNASNIAKFACDITGIKPLE